MITNPNIQLREYKECVRLIENTAKKCVEILGLDNINPRLFSIDSQSYGMVNTKFSSESMSVYEFEEILICLENILDQYWNDRKNFNLYAVNNNIEKDNLFEVVKHVVRHEYAHVLQFTKYNKWASRYIPEYFRTKSYWEYRSVKLERFADRIAEILRRKGI